MISMLWRPCFTSVSVPLRGFYVTRKDERPRRGTETDVTQGSAIFGFTRWPEDLTPGTSLQFIASYML